ncbi:Sucrose transport protein SUT1 [Apostasia shenzhenica]|uniref:Sucrose transport protein SUT1 n=1 Tax=Apostasia shenzhenica TaxID=1088818 RepID=A0A2I0A5C0_9ASPA|nr:Sucrose transport protein SUT1 [Apostasia shenzhenica]
MVYYKVSMVGRQPDISLARFIFTGMVAGGVQYGWALQLSLLTPYVHTLGIPHSLASIMWLFGPISGFVVGPTIGLWSDRCKSSLGRRRPFILAGCLVICLSVLGSVVNEYSTYFGPQWKAAIIFVVGFCILDISNNVVQGPARAMMADLSGKHGCRAGNIIYAFWMAAGNILGYSSGASANWHKWLPVLVTNSCCEACANLKGAFLVAVVFLVFCLMVTLICAKEVPLSELYEEVSYGNSGLLSIIKAFKELPAGMPQVFVLTSLSWLAWFPFLLYNTDWVGREIYHGDLNGTKAEIDSYNKGVQIGAFGLLLNSVIHGISSVLLEPMCSKFSSRIVWVIGNFTLFVAMVAVAVLSVISTNAYTSGSITSAVSGPDGIKIGALAIFAALGFPLAILYSIPFATVAQLATNAGGTNQGLCIGALNISIVIPQVIIGLGAGPWNALFGKGNIPAFAFAAALSLLSGLAVIAIFPKLSSNLFKSISFGSMH